MKTEPVQEKAGRKIFIAVILLLCLGGAAASRLFFGFGYRLAKSRYKSSSQVPHNHLNRYDHFTRLMESHSVQAGLVQFPSERDQTMLSAWIMEPASGKPDKLFFFFHGMNGDGGDAVVIRDFAEKMNAKVVSFGGRGPAWISDAWLADASQVIRKYSPGFPGFYLTGISMGGTQALALAGLLPEDLRGSVLGVLAFIPSADLNFTAAHSNVPQVRQSILDSVDGDLEKLKQRSPSSLIERYKAQLPFAVFYQTRDETLPVRPLQDFIRLARQAGHPVGVFSEFGEHIFEYLKFPYSQVFESLGKDADISLEGIQ